MRVSPSDPPPAQSADKLLALLNIAQRLNAERDLAALLTLIAREAARLLDAELASVFLLDAQRHELWSKVTLDAGQTLRFGADVGLAGEALRTGQMICVDDVSRDPRFFPGVDLSTGHRTKNLLALPLRSLRGEIIGVFEVLNKGSGSFTAEDVELARLLADQIGIALETAQLLGQVQRDRDSLVAANAALRKEVEGRFATQRILGASPAIRAAITLIEQVADSSASVLITGESGTGKELAAKAIHYASPRAGQPLVALNCAALPEALVESELFGIERGVATGVEARPGKFETAGQGTLFLDEIGDLSLAAQAKLLRVLQERLIERVGGRQPIAVEARVLAATNKDLAAAVKAGTFREDLYYRLNVIQIRMPPLRQVASDIPLIAAALLAEHCREQGRSPPELTAEALELLARYRWPGNVRELGNEMKRLATVVRRGRIEPADLAEPIRGGEAASAGGPPNLSLKDAVAGLERRMIAQALQECRHNQQQAARRLGLSRQGLIKKMKRYGLSGRSES
jgi:Nif-specific regulatory protein